MARLTFANVPVSLFSTMVDKRHALMAPSPGAAVSWKPFSLVPQ